MRKIKPNDSAAEEKGICPDCGHLWYVHSKDGCMLHVPSAPEKSIQLTEEEWGAVWV
jgi:hypothetical protein